MRNLSIAGLVAGVFLATAAFAADLSKLQGTHVMTWPNGQKGTYVVHSISESAAEVTYSYGGKSQTKVLKVKNGKIRGGGWFPTLSLKNNGTITASHSGSSATVASQ